MGRKPNPLVAQYFERGSKIGDASNRYEHTCKKCGEHFAKGRIEALTTHLTKKCLAISKSERTQIVIRMHNLTDLGADLNEVTSRDGGQGESAGAAGLPRSQESQNFNGLNVLAEASRQVGGNAQNNSGYTPADQAPAEAEFQTQAQGDAQSIDPQLDPEAFPDHFLNEDGMGARSNGFPTTASSGLPALYSFMTNGPPVTQDELATLPVTATHPPDLSSIAASANETLAGQMIDNEIEMTHDEVSSALLNSLQGENSLPQGEPQMTWSTQLPGTSTQLNNQMPLPPVAPGTRALLPATSFAMDPNTQPTTHFVVESGTLAKAPKPKVRGRFDEERRKEVRELRKLGACMRCRMLKKVCSQETPCQTCAAVESPRVWKQACVRTKLTEAFPLYSVIPYSVFADNALSNLKGWSSLENLDARLVAWYFPEHKLNLKVQKSKVKRNKTVQPPAIANEEEIFIISIEDPLPPKIERFLQAMRAELVGRETSEVMRSTLALGQAMLDEQQLNTPTEKSDDLLANVIELWTATVLLTDQDVQPNFMLEDDATQDTLVVEGEQYQYARMMMTLQLQAGIEKRTSRLSRAVMNHLEQRVLERKRNQSVETAMVAFILLNCAERMCWRYQSWAEPGYYNDTSSSSTSNANAWPLHLPAGEYAARGGHFAEIIHLLLSLRQMDPSVQVNPVSGYMVPRDPNDTALALWLSHVPITKEWVMQGEAAVFDSANSRSLDGSLCARLFQA